MKNKAITIIMALLLTLGLAAGSSFAAEKTSYFIDDASIVSSETQKEIDSRLADISKAQKSGVYLMTTDDFQGMTPQEFADFVYEENGMGYGSSHDGIILVLNYDSGDWAISTTGSGISTYTDAGQEYLMENVTKDLREDPPAAFSVYADLCEDFLIQAAKGKPYDVGNMPKDFNLLIDIAIGIVIGLLIAYVIVKRQKDALRSVRRRVAAKEYMRPGSLKLTAQNEQYLYNTVDRIEKETSSGGGSSSGGSTTHVSSSGTTHGGSSGKF